MDDQAMNRRTAIGVAAGVLGAVVLKGQAPAPAVAPDDPSSTPGLPSEPLGARSPFETPALSPVGVTTGSSNSPLPCMKTSRSRRTTITKGSDNIFRDLGFSPAEAENLRIRSQLLIALEQVVHAYPTQAEAAKRLGVTQPRVSDIVRGRIDLFSVDSLIELLGRANIRVKVRIEPNAA